MPTSPDILNLYIGKGIVKFTPTGGAERDVGEVSVFSTEPNIETLPYNSNRSGIRKKVREVTVETSLTLTMQMDEVTAENLSMAMMSDVVENTDGTKSLRIMSKSQVTGRITFTGSNDVGNKLDIDLPNVSFRPSSAFSPLSEEWAGIEVTGEVLANEYTDGSSDFGTILVTDAA